MTAFLLAYFLIGLTIESCSLAMSASDHFDDLRVLPARDLAVAGLAAVLLYGLLAWFWPVFVVQGWLREEA